MRLWRVSNHATLDGRGGLETAGRWSSRGRPVVYTAEHAALALLETMVHAGIGIETMPRGYQLLAIDAPDRLAVETVAIEKLPAGWADNELITRAIGDAWLRARKSALLKVPSVVAAESWNYLINPLHPEAEAITLVSAQRYPFDRRLLPRR